MLNTQQLSLPIIGLLDTESLPAWCFRELSPSEEAEFRASAREKYVVGTRIEGLWHPVYRDECLLMNLEGEPT